MTEASTLLHTRLVLAAIAAIAALACARVEKKASGPDSSTSTSSTVVSVSRPADSAAMTRAVESASAATALITGSDTASCKTGGLADYEQEYLIPVLDAPNGKLLYEFHNDSTNDDIYGLSISGYADGFLLVRPWSIEHRPQQGWVDRKYVWVFGRNYSRSLKLYSEPREDSPPKVILREWWSGLYAVVRCRGDWLYVRATIQKKVYEGWMPKDLQCDNPYTTCS
ncbi:MAG TPA: hypothetical protein VK491_06040 [Gemmatimonadaceae bacterium]|nr:hypothetical protein [Gemmatimonadaceae bacterium]